LGFGLFLYYTKNPVHPGKWTGFVFKLKPSESGLFLHKICCGKLKSVVCDEFSIHNNGKKIVEANLLAIFFFERVSNYNHKLIVRAHEEWEITA